MNHEAEVVFLRGLPDMEESRPHSRINSDRDLLESTAASGASFGKTAAPPHSQGSPGKDKSISTSSSWQNAGKILALLPAEVRAVIEGMFRARVTTYAHDPRTARVIVEDDGRGGITVKAETRLVPGEVPD